MLRMRCHWQAAAGLLLTVAANPAATQTVPPVKELPDKTPPRPAARADSPDGVLTLPAPRPTAAPAPAPVAAGPEYVTAGFGGSWWQRWRAEHHARWQAKMWGYPEEFQAPPLGAAMNANFRPMVANGEAAGMVLFQMDFLQGRDRLNMHGLDRLARMATRLPHNPFPIIVERTTGGPGLDEARRAAVLIELAREGLAVPPERVVIGPRLSVGLPGTDALSVYRYYNNNLDSQGQSLLVPNFGGGGTTGSSGTRGGGVGGFGPTIGGP